MNQGLQPLSFLVLEDSIPMGELLRTVLNGLGVQHIHFARDIRTARSILDAHVIDIVMVDMELGGEDGLEFVREIRGDEDSRSRFVAVIAVSADTREKRIRAARDAGVTEYCAKPISIRQIARRIEEVILRPRPFVRTVDFLGPDRRRWTDPGYGGPERRNPDGPFC